MIVEKIKYKKHNLLNFFCPNDFIDYSLLSIISLLSFLKISHYFGI